MTTKNIYRYLGRNGIITSEIKLEKIDPILMFNLTAEKGKILTNGVEKTYSITLFEDEIKNWYEIDDIGQE